MDTQHTSPVFIHSLFRSGSTYLFHVFRRSERGYWCYQEPLNEKLLYNATRPGGFLASVQGAHEYLRHPEMEKPHCYEYHVATDEVLKYFKKEFSYDQFFAGEKDDCTEINTYFTALLKAAKGIPVFQCCRTTGRVTALKKAFGGVHLFLWRNPWDQWWSYKRDAYFVTRNLFIAEARQLPGFLVALKKALNFPSLQNTKPEIKHGYLSSRMLDAATNYKLFYALWCHAMLEAKPNCELSISIDRLSLSDAYREEKLARLKQLGIDGLDFSDCAVPIAQYGKSDGAFFLEAENFVHELLLSNGYSIEQVDELKKLGAERERALADTSAPGNAAVRDAMHAREYLLQAEGKLFETQNMLFHTRARARQAEARAREAEARAEQAEARVREIK